MRLENAKKKMKIMSDATCVQKNSLPFAEQTEETTKMLVFVLAKETVKNIVRVSAQLKEVVRDVPVYLSLFAVKRALLTIISAICNALRTDF